MQVIGATLGSVVVNIAGRRSLLIASTGLCSLCMGLLGTVFFLKKHEPESVIIQVPRVIRNIIIHSLLQAAGAWLPVACLLSFTFVFTVGLGPVPWVFLGELFPADVRCDCATTINTYTYSTGPMLQAVLLAAALLSFSWLISAILICW